MRVACNIWIYEYSSLLKTSPCFSSIPNTFFANLDPERNTIKLLDLEDEETETYGAADIEDLHGNNSLMDTLALSAEGVLLSVLQTMLANLFHLKRYL